MARKTQVDKVASPADIKLLNRQRILDVFKTGEKRTAMDVQSATGISKPTIMRTLQYFCDGGILRSAGLAEASRMGGKKPECFTLADRRPIVCIALWPGRVTLAMSYLVGDVYNVKHYDHELEEDLDRVFTYLKKILKDYLAEEGLDFKHVYGVELSTAGTVDYKSNKLLYNSQSPGWGSNIDLEKYLRRIFGSKIVCYVENAGKAVGRATLLDWPELSRQRVMTIFTTWGISACLIDNGHVMNGKDSLIGEIGHMTISDSDPVVCNCGKKGCLEIMVSISRVKKILVDRGEEKLAESITFPELFEYSEQGNEAARAAVAYLAHRFAIALHNISLSYNPDIVIFLGDFAYADNYFDQCLTKELQEFRYYPHSGIFRTEYDKRELSVLAARGGSTLLKKKYFSTIENELKNDSM